jgi:hypothetical protein
LSVRKDGGLAHVAVPQLHEELFLVQHVLKLVDKLLADGHLTSVRLVIASMQQQVFEAKEGEKYEWGHCNLARQRNK